MLKVLSHLDYCPTVWFNTAKQELNKIQLTPTRAAAHWGTVWGGACKVVIMVQGGRETCRQLAPVVYLSSQLTYTNTRQNYSARPLLVHRWFSPVTHIWHLHLYQLALGLHSKRPACRSQIRTRYELNAVAFCTPSFSRGAQNIFHMNAFGANESIITIDVLISTYTWLKCTTVAFSLLYDSQCQGLSWLIRPTEGAGVLADNPVHIWFIFTHEGGLNLIWQYSFSQFSYSCSHVRVTDLILRHLRGKHSLETCRVLHTLTQ